VKQLPDDVVVIGIDEKTALVVDFEQDVCRTMGSGTVTIVRRDEVRRVERRGTFRPTDMGLVRRPDPSDGIPTDVWTASIAADATDSRPTEPSPAVLELLDARTAARAKRDWSNADRIRARIGELGWQVNDGPDGAQLVPLDNGTVA
jgi:hypothetical protein